MGRAPAQAQRQRGQQGQAGQQNVNQLCDCNSGLRAVRCCKLNMATISPPEAGSALRPIVEKAQAAMQANKPQEAEKLVLEVLELSPGAPGALGILAQIRRQEKKPRAAEVLLTRLVRIDPNNYGAVCDLAQILFSRHAWGEAEARARSAIRLRPRQPQGHNLLGMILTEANRPKTGEFHYRKVLELREPDAIIYANLAWNLKAQGRMDESRELYEKSMVMKAGVLQTLLGYARMEETDRKFDHALELLDQAEAVSANNPSIMLTRAVIAGRNKDYEGAVSILNDIEKQRQQGLGPEETLEKGRLFDKMGNYDDAFKAFIEGKKKYTERSGNKYRDEVAKQQIGRIKNFFTKGRLEFTPRGSVKEDSAQPIFVVGFMRSGTTMIEQTLASHSKVSAGDELTYISEITQIMPRMLASPLTYPEALSDLWFGDQTEGLENMRDYYLQRVRQQGVIKDGSTMFTDKMPLNETHMGLITLMFPKAPILHVIRHPLDVILSVFSNHMTHGMYCSYALESAATHYARVFDLIEHYKTELGDELNYLPVRYEDVVANQEEKVREMLDFVGLEFEQACLDFHENTRYARTASYAQVTEKLYDSSVHRYQNYLDQLKPVIPILEPAIKKLGYEI